MLESSNVGGGFAIGSPMPPGRRILLAMLGLVPLIAPYELLVTPAWTVRRHPAFVFVACVGDPCEQESVTVVEGSPHVKADPI